MISAKYLILTICLAIVLHEGSAKKYFGRGTQNKDALTARHVVHNSDWASVGTISVTPEIKTFPFVGLKSIADGPTGIPYMLMTDMDVSMNDINHNNKCTLFMSLAQGDFCRNRDYDPQDPRCARVMLTGSIDKVVKGSDEETLAKAVLYEKHPAMRSWPTDHNFFIAKLNIIQISLLDFFGGIKHVTPAEYYAANAESYSDFLENMTNDIEVVHIKF